MSKLSFRARALDASKPMPIYLAEELPDLPDYSAINRAVPQMPSGMEKEEESEHHLQRAISGTGLIIPTPEVCEVTDLVFYERCYPPDYKMPKQHIHMQPLWEEQEAPEYDMDSEDERWLKQQRHPDLTELVFEQMMDKLEKCSGQTVVTLSEAKLLLDRHDDLVIAVYDYWLNKRLNTQHPLILSVRTESRPGQPANNPYLAFRRRTEKMQTRKNRKNDESSYEKMLKLRRDLARALSLLQLVARRERAKRDLVRLTHALAAARYRAGDYVPDPPPRAAPPVAPPVPHLQHADTAPARAVFAAVSAGSAASALRREALAVQYTHTPDRQPRQREKRPYKRKKHRHHALGAIPPPHRTECPSGASSSEEEASGEAADPGPFAFRRKPGCYYEMPTSTLCGEPLPGHEDVYEHEVDERHRYTLASLSDGQCVGLCRRRAGRGGRVLLDRRASPLDDLWRRLPPAATHSHHPLALQQRREQVEFETKAHRTPKEMCRDYHSSGRYPWRHAFRQHLAARPQLWLHVDVKPHADDVKPHVDDVKLDDIKIDDFKMDVDDESLPQDSDISLRTVDVKVNSDPVVLDEAVRGNLSQVLRKRAWSPCSDESGGDDDGELYPVEKEFDKFINEVTRKWLHFRPKTPPPSPPYWEADGLERDDPFAVELLALGARLPFTSAPLTLAALQPTSSGHTESSGTAPEAAEGDSIAADVDTDAFLSQGQGLSGRASPGRGERGSSRVSVRAPASPAVPRPRPPTPPTPPALTAHTAPPHKQVDRPPTPVKKVQTPKDDSKREEREREKQEREREREKERERAERERERQDRERREWPPPSPVPNSKIIVEEVNEVPQQIKLEKKKSGDTIEEVVLAHGVQLKTVQTKHSPLKKHIITSGAARRDPAAPAHQQPPQLLTVAVSDNLKVRIQNHIVSERVSAAHAAAVSGVSGVSGAVVGLVGNGPFASVVSAAPTVQSSAALTLHHTTHTVASVAAAGGGARRASGVARGPLVQLAGGVGLATSAHAPVVLAPSHTIHHVAPNKLKVLHAHPLTHTQRNQLLATQRGMASLPAVVSLATLGEAKSPGAALLKAAPGSVAQFIEIKGTPFAKGPHLVNVVRAGGGGGGAAGGAKGAGARLDLTDSKKRQVVATLDAHALKGNIQAVPRAHRVNVSVEARGVVRAAQPVAVRAHHLRHQIQLKGRALIPPGGAGASAGGAGGKGAAIPGAVVANLLHKNVQLPKGGQKIAISSGVSMGTVSVSGAHVGGSVQAIAFTTAQLKARQARLIAQPRHAPPHSEMVEAVAGPSAGGGGAGAGDADDDPANGVRRAADTLPMEVT